jgi:hypothetical protein
MIPLLIAALFALPAAAQQVVKFEFSRGEDVFEHSLKVEENAQANFMGSVSSKDGESTRRMILNVVMGELTNGAANLDYQAELTDSMGGTFQAQSALEVGPGNAIKAAAQCGGWSLKISVLGRKAPIPAANHRLTAESGQTKCSGAVKTGAQMNIVSAAVMGGRKSGTVFVAVAGPGKGGALDVQWQFQGAGLQAQSQTALALGRKVVAAKGQGGTLSLLAEALK